MLKVKLERFDSAGGGGSKRRKGEEDSGGSGGRGGVGGEGVSEDEAAAAGLVDAEFSHRENYFHSNAQLNHSFHSNAQSDCAFGSESSEDCVEFDSDDMQNSRSITQTNSADARSRLGVFEVFETQRLVSDRSDQSDLRLQNGDQLESRLQNGDQLEEASIQDEMQCAIDSILSLQRNFSVVGECALSREESSRGGV